MGYVNAPDLYNNTPLLNACAKNYDKVGNNRCQILKYLIDNFAEPNHRNSRTVLI